jgi:quaternary ammonium compound-resistance protein SugE
MTPTRAWVLLTIAGVCEVVWAVALKLSQGLTRPVATVVTVIGLAASMWLLAQAFRVLPAGSGYAVWVGIGAVGTALVGMIALGESRAPLRVAAIALIVLGIVGLRLAR